MFSTTKSGLRAVMLAGLFVAGWPATAAAGDGEIKLAQGKVKSSAKIVLALAYPTAKELTETEHVRGTKAADGSFKLTYLLSYVDSDGDDAHVKLQYSFDKDGKATSVKELDRSSLWPAFGTAKLALVVIKEAIKSDAKLKNDPDLKKLLTVTEPSEFVVGMINATRSEKD